MTKEKIIEKLCSRKLWMAVACFVAMLIVFFGGAEETATQVVALIMAGATCIAYIVGEGFVDAAEEDSTHIEESSSQDSYEGATVTYNSNTYFTNKEAGDGD